MMKIPNSLESSRLDSTHINLPVLTLIYRCQLHFLFAESYIHRLPQWAGQLHLHDRL